MRPFQFSACVQQRCRRVVSRVVTARAAESALASLPVGAGARWARPAALVNATGAFEAVGRERRSHMSTACPRQEEEAEAESRVRCSQLLEQLWLPLDGPHGASSSLSLSSSSVVVGHCGFPPQLFPNMRSAKLSLELPRGDGLFHPVFRRHDALLSRLARASAEPTSDTASCATAAVHPLLRDAPVETAMDAARLLPALFLEAATAAAARENARRRGATRGSVCVTARSLLDEEAFVSAMGEQLFLSAFFAVPLAGGGATRWTHHPTLPLLLSSFSVYQRFPLGAILPLGPGGAPSSSAALREALEVCLARLLLASPFSFHVAFEYLLGHPLLNRSCHHRLHIPLTLFRLWWIVNPDQVPLERSGSPARPLPSLFDEGTGQFASVAVRRGSWEGWRRTAAYREGVMSSCLRHARRTSGGGCCCLVPECFYPFGSEAAYAAAVKALATAALASGDAKHSVTCPLLPRVLQLSAVVAVARWEASQGGTAAAPPKDGDAFAFVRLLFSGAVVPFACEAAPNPPQEVASWLTLCSLMTAVGLLNGGAGSLRRLPRRGKHPRVSKDSYEERLEQLRALFTSFVEALVRESASSSSSSSHHHHHREEEEEQQRQLAAWSRMVFVTVSSAFELSGALSPSASYRPLTMSAFWSRLHHQSVESFPNVFHAGSNAVATLFALTAIEGASSTAEGRGAVELFRTSIGREVALAKWRHALASQEKAKDGGEEEEEEGRAMGAGPHLETAVQRRSRQRQISYLLSRVLPSSGDVAEAASGRGRRTRTGSPSVDRAAKDIAYPPHAFASGCGGGHPSEVLDALQSIRAAVLTIAREHVSLLMLREDVVGEVPAVEDDPLEAEVLAARAAPSFFVLLKTLQALATVGEDKSERGVNLVAECVCKDVLPFVHPVVASYVSKLAVQSLVHSAAETGAVPLLSKHRCLLNALPPEAAWAKVVEALLWSGLPAGPLSARLLAAAEEEEGGEGGEGAKSAAGPPWNPEFGSDALAWSLMVSGLTAPPPTPPTPADADTERLVLMRHAQQLAQKASSSLALSLDHLAALAFPIPDDARRPVLLAPLLLAEEACVFVKAAGEPTRDTTATTAKSSARMEEAAATPCDGVYDDDDDGYNDYPYFAEEHAAVEQARQGEDRDRDEDGELAAAAEADRAVEVPLPPPVHDADPLQPSSPAALFPLPSPVMSDANAGEGSKERREAKLRKGLSAALDGCPPAAQHLYTSFLEVLGACAVATSPASNTGAVPSSSLSLLVVGYSVLHSLFTPQRSPIAETLRLPTPGHPPRAQGLRQPRVLVKLILFHLHTIPDVALLSEMVLCLAMQSTAAGSAAARTATSPTTLLPRRVVSSLCQLLYHSGVTHKAVRSWRRGQPTTLSGEEGEEDGFLAAHRAQLAQMHASPPPQQVRKESLLRLLGSLVLATVEPPVSWRFPPLAFDARDYYISAFMSAPAQDEGAGIGVVLPSQQLVSFATASGVGAPQRALSLTEVTKRMRTSGTAPPHASLPLLSRKPKRGALDAALEALERSEFTDLFTR